MIKYLCDRCEKVTSIIQSSEDVRTDYYEEKISVVTKTDHSNFKSSLDLCLDCHQSLLEWFKSGNK